MTTTAPDVAALAVSRSIVGRWRKFSSLISLFSFCTSTVALAVMVPILVRALGASAYGAWVLSIGLIGYLNVLDFGLSFSVTRFVARERWTNPRIAEEAITVAVGGVTVVGATLVGATMVLAPLWSRLTDVPGTAFAFRAAGVAAMVVLVTKVLQSAIEGADRVALSRVVQSFATAVMAAGSIAIALTVNGVAGKLRMLAIFYVLQSVCVAIMYFALLVREWGSVPFAQPHRTNAVTVLKYALGVQASSALALTVDPASRILVGALFGPAAVTPLDIAIRTRAQVIGAFQAFLRPLLPRIVREGWSPADAQAHASLAYRQMAVVAPSAAVILALIVVWLFPAVFGGSVGGDAALLAVVGILLWIPPTIATVPYLFLVVFGTARDLVMIQLATSVIAVAITAAGAPIWGGIAAIGGFGAAATVGAILTVVRARRVAGDSGAFSLVDGLTYRIARATAVSATAGAALLLPIPLPARILTAFATWTLLMFRDAMVLVRYV